MNNRCKAEDEPFVTKVENSIDGKRQLSELYKDFKGLKLSQKNSGRIVLTAADLNSSGSQQDQTLLREAQSIVEELEQTMSSYNALDQG